MDVNWGDGTADTKLSLTAAGTIPATAHTYATAGSKTVSISVTDAKADPTNKVTFTVIVAPEPGIVVTAPAAQTSCAGASKSFALGSFTATNATGPFSVDVNWGDGTADTKLSLSAQQGRSRRLRAHVCHRRNKTVSISVTDAKADPTSKVTFTLTVSP